MNVPLLLSDIKSFREQCEDTASYFDLNDENNFVVKLKQLISNKSLMSSNAERARKRAIENFTLVKHMEGLRNIYAELIPQNPLLPVNGYTGIRSIGKSINHSRK